ncbi:MAG: hypothetical protein ACE5H9_15645 [Anaerolineae bacterium]
MQRGWLIVSALVIAATGFAGLAFVVTRLYPSDPLSRPDHLVRGLFIFLLFVSIGAGFVPVAAYLNRRFARGNWLKRDPGRLLREGIWVGLFVAVCAYLRLYFFLNWTLVAVLAGALALMETFFLTRE